jgi:hypothetical protein
MLLLFSFVSVSVAYLFLAAACKVDGDPSAGIDSECSEVAGDVPSIQQQPESVPIVPEDTVIIKVKSYCHTVTAYLCYICALSFKRNYEVKTVVDE